MVAKVISSIRNQNYPREKVELIVVDNGSVDGTPNLINRRFPWVKLIRLNRNTGSAYPITLAAKQAKREYILATNDDVIFDKNCLKELVKLILTDPSVGMVTGKMLYLAPPHKIAIPGFKINPYFGYQPYDLTDSHKVRPCDWAPGACMLIKRQLLASIGYFDDKYFFCGDDYDVCFRIRSCGYHIMYAPRAVFYHAFSRAGGQKKPSRDNLFAHYRGKFRYALKNSSPVQIATTIASQVIVGPIYTYLMFRNNTWLPTILALAWNIKHLNETLASRRQAKILSRKCRLKSQLT